MEKKFIKKIVAVLAAVAMVAGVMSVSGINKVNASDAITYPVYTVAGSEELTGSSWNANITGNEANVMTGTDGVYTKVYTDVQPGSYSYKVIKHTAEDQLEWIGVNGNNVTFTVETACDVTITYNSSTGGIATTGDGLGGYKLTNMSMAGSAALFGADWTHVAMTETSEGSNVWVYTAKNVPKGSYVYKYSTDNSWTHSWGVGGAYNAADCELEVGSNGSTVTFTVNLQGVDLSEPSKSSLANAASVVVVGGTYAVKFEVGDNIVVKTGDETVQAGAEYYAVLEAKDGYVLPETISVTVDGVESEWYGYVQETGEICIAKPGTTGTILITAEAVKEIVPGPYSVTYEIGDNLIVTNGPETIGRGDEFYAVLQAKDGYVLPETISVTVDGVESEWYGYFQETGEIGIAKPGTTGAIVITAEAVKEIVEETTKAESTTEEETTVEEETTKVEPTTEEETTKDAETSTKPQATREEATTEEETTTKTEVTTEEETTTKTEATTEEETTTKTETTTKEEETEEETTVALEKPSVNTTEEGKNSAPETVKKEEIVEPEKVVDTAVEKMEKTDDKNVEVVSPKPQTLTKEIFDTIKSEGKNLTVGVTDADNKLQYSWTFSDKAISNTNMNIDLTITFDAPKKEEISKLTGNKEAAYISFAHHGELPGAATIKTYVGDKYKNGDVVYLYYFDEENNKVLMVGDKPLTIKAGYAEYTITHCSTYFLMGEKLAGVAKDVASLDDANVNVKDSETESTTTSSNPGNTAKPGDNSHIVIWSAILCIMVGIVVFSRRKQLIEE
ncbi:MAG: hypothetical protein IJD58_02790 [Lachnospiraceae bacterium]|nr:hypothetical protein [Lachnospiraceae bacterium]